MDWSPHANVIPQAIGPASLPFLPSLPLPSLQMWPKSPGAKTSSWRKLHWKCFDFGETTCFNKISFSQKFSDKIYQSGCFSHLSLFPSIYNNNFCSGFHWPEQCWPLFCFLTNCIVFIILFIIGYLNICIFTAKQTT